MNMRTPIATTHAEEEGDAWTGRDAHGAALLGIQHDGGTAAVCVEVSCLASSSPPSFFVRRSGQKTSSPLTTNTATRPAMYPSVLIEGAARQPSHALLLLCWSLRPSSLDLFFHARVLLPSRLTQKTCTLPSHLHITPFSHTLTQKTHTHTHMKQNTGTGQHSSFLSKTKTRHPSTQCKAKAKAKAKDG